MQYFKHQVFLRLLLLLIYIFENILSNIKFYKPQCNRYISSYNNDESKQIDLCYNDPYDVCNNISYLSNTWVEVSRVSIPYLIKKSIQKNILHQNWIMNSYEIYGWNEGYSTGFPGSDIDNLSAVAYGCWFYLAEGSGIYVNIGNTLSNTRNNLFSLLNLDENGCIKNKYNYNNDFDINNYQCIDKYFCTKAIELGYDSIQVMDRKELVICNNQCSYISYDSSCPPIELRRNNALDICYCTNSKPYLNCDDHQYSNISNGIIIDNCIHINNTDKNTDKNTYLTNDYRNNQYYSENIEISIAFTPNLLLWNKNEFQEYFLQLNYSTNYDKPLLIIDIELDNNSALIYNKIELLNCY